MAQNKQQNNNEQNGLGNMVQNMTNAVQDMFAGDNQGQNNQGQNQQRQNQQQNQQNQ